MPKATTRKADAPVTTGAMHGERPTQRVVPATGNVFAHAGTERERCGRAYGSREVAMTAEIARLRERVHELEADPNGGDVIPLAEPRFSELERLRAENAQLAREAHTWWTALAGATAEIEQWRRTAERCVTAWTVVRGGVWDPNGLMDEHVDALRKALRPNAKLTGLQRAAHRSTDE